MSGISGMGGIKRILYLGVQSGTCLDRAHALRRLGYEVDHLDLRLMLPATVWVDRITWRIGGHCFTPWLVPRLRASLRGKRYDLCLVDGGEWVTGPIVRVLREHALKVINYNIDDPTGPRDGARFKAYRSAIALHDLAVVMRPDNVDELRALGMPRAMHVYRSSDEVSHAPRPISEADARQWRSDILFLGTWMPERGPFLLALIQAGLPLTIRGPNWEKAPEWAQLKPYWKGPAIGGDDYARAIQCARISIGLLSKGNRDLHTTRSMEIPSLGGLLCAERTTEHQQLYQEGAEAVFWSNTQECVSACRALLQNDALCEQIRAAGQARHLASPNRNERMLARVIEAATS